MAKRIKLTVTLNNERFIEDHENLYIDEIKEAMLEDMEYNLRDYVSTNLSPNAKWEVIDDKDMQEGEPTRTYKETLEFAEKNNINVVDLLVATEVDFHFGNIEHFEEICSKIKDCYLHTTTVNLESLTIAFNELVTSKGLEAALKADRYLIINLAEQYE